MKKAITSYSLTIKSALLSPPPQHAAAIFHKLTMSLDKPDGFSCRWPHQCQSNPTGLASETTKPGLDPAEFASGKKLDYPFLAPQENLEISKTHPKRALSPLELTTTTAPDPPPLGPNPGRGPDFPVPPLQPPPIPDVPLKPPRNPPPKPPDEVPPRTPPEIVPPPPQMPPPVV